MTQTERVPPSRHVQANCDAGQGMIKGPKMLQFRVTVSPVASGTVPIGPSAAYGMREVVYGASYDQLSNDWRCGAVFELFHRGAKTAFRSFRAAVRR